MLTFELQLLPPDEDAVDSELLLMRLRKIPSLASVPGDPARRLYYNPHTTVRFEMILGDDLVAALPPVGASLDPLDPAATASTARPTRRHTLSAAAEDRSGNEDAEDAEDAEDDPSEALRQLPLLALVPLFRPSFFLHEAIAVLRDVAAGTDLVISEPHSGRADSKASPPEAALLAAWRSAHREVYPSLRDREAVCVWQEERCRRFYDYGSSLGELASRHAADGLHVAPMQPARHQGELKTLCVWSCEDPALLPQTELVLLRRRKRGGLFKWARTEELLVPWETLQNVLRTHAEWGSSPAPFLLVRQGASASERLARDLEAVSGEAPRYAKRAELAGVIDFDVEAQDDNENEAGRS